MRNNKFGIWAIEQHRNCNHMYNGNLPYEFHLNMVVTQAHRFSHLLPRIGVSIDIMESAAYGHDLIEDCRINYNDIVQKGNRSVAELIYAVTNDKGRNRAERASDKHYSDMAKSPGAPFLKMCDRIANVRFSYMMYDRNKLEMYRKELPKLEAHLFSNEIQEMFDELKTYFNENQTT